VSLEKLDNFYIGRFLECLGEIWRARQKFRREFKDIGGFDRGFDQALTTSVC
jgi:hypothetical protein